MAKLQSLHILVTGGAGEIGSQLVHTLSAKGHRLRVLVLPNDPNRDRLNNLDVEVVEGDISNPTSLNRICDGIDTIYHLAAILLGEDKDSFERINHRGTLYLANAALAARVKHFIYISSASVVYPQTTYYSRSKKRAEISLRNIVNDSQMNLTIVRPTLVFDGKGGLEYALFRKHLERFPLFAFMLGSGRALKRPVFVDDLIDGLGKLATNSTCYNKTYNLSGGEVLSLNKLAKLLLTYADKKRALIHLPLPLVYPFITLAGKIIGKSLLIEHTIAGLSQDADLDPQLAVGDLDYRPRGISEILLKK